MDTYVNTPIMSHENDPYRANNLSFDNYKILRFHDLEYRKISNSIQYRRYAGTLIGCEYCGRYINLRKYPNRTYCHVCESERVPCSGCGEYMFPDAHCENCQSQCDCGEWVYNDDLFVTDDGYHICQTCYDHCYECDYCDGRFYRSSSLSRHIRYDHDDMIENETIVRPYSYKPQPEFIGKPANKRYFGIELEFEFSGKPVNLIESKMYYHKHDGSLQNGCELVTHPISLDIWNTRPIDNILETYSRQGYKSHDVSTCGLHIHVSKNSAKLTTWAKVALFWYNNPDFISSVCRRSNNHYCEFKQVRKQQSTYRLTYSDTRYESINFQNDNTVEFRQFKGSLNPDTLLATIQFVDCLIGFCSRVKLTDIDNANIVTQFVAYVIKKANHDDKYNALINYLKTRGI